MKLDLSPVNVLTINEAVYNKLLNAIVAGKLPPGMKITMKQLADQFHVSLMPVREALKRLEAGNFITILKSRRIVVKKLSVDELNELLQIRLNLESMAAKRAAKDCTDETIKKLEHLQNEVKVAKDTDEFLEKNKQFHFILYQNANMPILQEIIQNLWWRVSPYLHIYTAGTPNYKELKIYYHEGIVQGMRERNPKKVCKWLALDLKKAAELVSGLLITEKEIANPAIELDSINDREGGK